MTKFTEMQQWKLSFAQQFFLFFVFLFFFLMSRYSWCTNAKQSLVSVTIYLETLFYETLKHESVFRSDSRLFHK